MEKSKRPELLTIKEIQQVLKEDDYTIVGNKNTIRFNNAKPLAEANLNSVSWISPKNKNGIKAAQHSQACLIICKTILEIPENLKESKCFIQTDNPKLVFSKIVSELIKTKPAPGKHPTAYIHEEAEIAPDVYIGPFTYVGKCIIGPGSVVWGQCYLHDGVSIGKNVEIHAGCVIGDDGSGYSKNEDGEWIKFPHIGSAILEDDVEIGAQTYINKGALGNTIIRRGAKIGNAVCIGHNVIVGENTIVLANSLICGSTQIDKNVYVAPSTVIKNKLKVSSGATIGMGAVVLKNVPENTTMIGNPATTLEEYGKWSRLKKKLFSKFE
jgi:UDP-3-O-[3-hydroxymyristoyl] glucosamine N-acyltransferase